MQPLLKKFSEIDKKFVSQSMIAGLSLPEIGEYTVSEIFDNKKVLSRVCHVPDVLSTKSQFSRLTEIYCDMKKN